MNRSAPATVAIAGAALAVAAVAHGSAVTGPPPDADRHAFEVVSTRVFADTVGKGKGTLQARVKARYRYTPASARERWFGVTTITLRGPGGTKTVRDADRLVHPASGQLVDHRVVLGPKEARRILGTRGLRAKVRVTVRGHLEMRGAARQTGALVTAPGGAGGNGGAGGDAGAVVGVGGNAGSGGNGGNGGAGGLFSITPVASYPPQFQSWGMSLFVYWTNGSPSRPYVGSFYAPGSGAGGGPPVVLQPNFDARGNPASGLLAADGSFRMVSTLAKNTGWCPPAPPAVVSGQVPPPGTGRVFPNVPATVSWQWSGLWDDCKGSQSVGPTQMARDAVGQ